MVTISSIFGRLKRQDLSVQHHHLFSVSFTCPGSTFDNIVNTKNHFCCFARAHQNTELALEGFCNSKLMHVSNGSIVHVKTVAAFTRRMGSTQLRHQLRRVITTIISHDGRKLAQSTCKRSHSECLFPRRGLDLTINGLCHEHFGASATINGPGILHGSCKNTQRIMERPLCLIQDVRRSAPKNDRAGLSRFASAKTDHLVFTDHHLFDEITLPHRDEIRPIKCAHYLTTSHCGETFDSIKVGMLNSHHTAFSKDGFG
mmetsp:Transcript_22139/g.39477  ORF Transcript_22139/g.39477 Transcript_22139/m.39477 type:complete len:258 (+) Transcript_22139:175-948(+)